MKRAKQSYEIISTSFKDDRLSVRLKTRDSLGMDVYIDMDTYAKYYNSGWRFDVTHKTISELERYVKEARKLIALINNRSGDCEIDKLQAICDFPSKHTGYWAERIVSGYDTELEIDIYRSRCFRDFALASALSLKDKAEALIKRSETMVAVDE